MNQKILERWFIFISELIKKILKKWAETDNIQKKQADKPVGGEELYKQNIVLEIEIPKIAPNTQTLTLLFRAFLESRDSAAILSIMTAISPMIDPTLNCSTTVAIVAARDHSTTLHCYSSTIAHYLKPWL